MGQKAAFLFTGLLTVALMMATIMLTGCGRAPAQSSATPAPGQVHEPASSADFLARVAEILGVSQQELEEAFSQARSEMIKNRGDNFPPPGMQGGPPGDIPRTGGVPPQLVKRIAQILGIEEERVADALAQAQTEMGVNASWQSPPGANFNPGNN